jgi:serine/threonine-protein kinase
MADLIAGKYEILGKIGQGGMGTVYKVRHTTLDSVFALKVLPDISADNPELVGRFQREARIMAKLKHDNIVRVFELAHERDVHCLVMDFIDGPTLAQHMRSVGLLSSLDALEIARQVGRALAYAHSRGVVHRDVKPSNVLIESTDPMRVLLSDFGIAKVEDAGERTRTGSLLGSLRYSAPEQLSGEDVAKIDARADVFALGLVIYEMFEGKAFHANRGEGEIYRRMLYDQAPIAPEFSRPVPPGVAALVTEGDRPLHRDARRG